MSGIQYVDWTDKLGSVAVAEPTPVTKTAPVAKFRTRDRVWYTPKNKTAAKSYVVMWIGPDRNDPSIIKVGLKSTVYGRMRLFYVDQDVCELHTKEETF